MSSIVFPVTDEFRSKHLKVDFNEFFNSSVESSSDIELGSFKLKHRVLIPVFVKQLLKVLNLTCWICKSHPPILKKPQENLATAYKNGGKRKFKCSLCGSSNKYINNVKELDKNKGVIYNNIQRENGTNVNSTKSISSHHLFKMVKTISEVNLQYYGLRIKFHPIQFFTKYILTPQKSYISSNSGSSEEIQMSIGSDVIYNSINELWEKTRNNILSENETQRLVNVMYGVNRTDSATTYLQLTTGKYSTHADLKSTQMTNTGRSTIIGGSDIPYDTVKIPKRSRGDVGVYYKVTEHNIDMIKNFKNLGLLISKPDEIVVGKTVKRMIMNDEIVVMVRYPVLNPESVSAFRVILTDESTITFSISSTSVSNADYDGDEMNFNLFGDMNSYIETFKYLYLPNKLIKGGDGKPTIKLVLNSPLAFIDILNYGKIDIKVYKHIINKLYRIVDKESFLNRYSSHMGKPILDGLFLMSMILPKEVIYTNRFIEVRDGIIIKYRRVIDGTWANASSILNSILTIIIAHTDKDTVAIFMENMRILTNEWLHSRNINISLTDYCHGYNSIRKTGGANFDPDLIKEKNNLLYTMAHSIKGDIHKAKILLLKLPVVTSNLTKTENSQIPFIRRGQVDNTSYNTGSNLFEGLSLQESVMAFANSKISVINSKRDVATTGDIANRVRSVLSSVSQNLNGKVMFNGHPLAENTISPFSQTETIAIGDNYPITQEYFKPNSTKIINTTTENDAEAIDGVEDTLNDEGS